MKELSIREKAHLYDEAIERANELLYVSDRDSLQRKTVEHIFPELKESEDERIRKEIITFIVTTPKERNNHKKWIAWLEAQGEHDNFRNKIQVGDKVTRNEDGVLVNLSQLNRVAKKQGEQKPAENKGMNLVEEEMTPFQKKVFCIIDTTIEEEQGLKQVCDELFALASNEIKQKLAWSEEDKNILQSILDEYGSMQIEKRNWLKSLKSRVQLKQEWNEEDDSRMDNLCHFLEEYGEQYYGYLTLQGTISWLKSLKPNKQWKPTEEQIKALEWQLANTSNASWQYKATKEIYKQLKQL